MSLSEEEEAKSPSKDLSKSPSKNASKSPSQRLRNASTIHQAMEAARLEEKAKMAAGVKRVQRGRGVKRATRGKWSAMRRLSRISKWIRYWRKRRSGVNEEDCGGDLRA